MDSEILLGCFSGTLEADPNIRRQAEDELTRLATNPGFLKGCMDIHDFGSDQLQGIPLSYRIASAVYFKNKILKCWGITDTSNANHIPIPEKHYIKSKLLVIITNNEYNIKQQFLSALKLIITIDYPHSWPELLEQTGIYFQLTAGTNNEFPLDENQLNKLYTGLVSLLEIVRKYRWLKNNEREAVLDPIIEQSFPYLLIVGNLLISKSEYLTEFSSEILKLILKIYKFATYYDLPIPLQQKHLIISWGQLHGDIINMNLPSYTANRNERDKDLLQISKALKWSLANLNRLLSRYITSSRVYKEFKTIYCNEFLPYLIKNLIKIIELWCSHQKWLNLSALYNLIEILSNAIDIKCLWLLVKPLLETLIHYFIYPIIGLTDEKIELFDQDPHEYIQLSFNIFLHDFNSPDIAAIKFLNRLLESRKKYSFDLVVNFVYQELYALVQKQVDNNGDDTLSDAIKKESLLRIIGSISPHLLYRKNKYYDEMEEFLMKLIVPNFSSNYKFVVARTFEIIGKFSDLEFKLEQNLNLVMYHILKNFRDNLEDNIIINLENALAIQSYLHIPQFKEHLSVIILPVMSRLLDISNEIDNDTISVVMQECVENFSEQLQPFGVELIYKLVESFMRIVTEMEETGAGTATSDNNKLDSMLVGGGGGEDHNDKIIAAIGILNTIITVLLSYENKPVIIQELTHILIPMVKYVLNSKNDNYLSEIGEIIENLIYLNKSVTPELYEILELVNGLMNDGIGLMYFEELLPSLKNYLIHGSFSNTMISDDKDTTKNMEHARNLIFLNIFSKMNTAYDNFNDLALSFELIQYFVLSLRTNVVSYLPEIGNQILSLFNIYQELEAQTSLLFKISYNNVIISALIYDSNMMILMLHEQFNLFLNNWFKLIPKLTRVYDIKLSILGLMSLINNSNIIINVTLSSNLVLLLKKLPHALKELNRRRSVFNADFHEDKVDNFEDTFGIDNSDDDQGHGSDDDDDEDQDHGSDNDQGDSLGTSTGGDVDYLNFLQQEDLKLDDIVEDPLERTPLDNINLTQIIHNFIHLLKSHDHEKYDKLFGDLSSTEMADIMSKIRDM